MNLAYYIKKAALRGDPRVEDMLSVLRSRGCTLYDVAEGILPGTDALVSFGGDGTFLSAAGMAAPAGVPVIGVNLGRLGFLSENTPSEALGALLCGEFVREERSMLSVSFDGPLPDGWNPLALNEVCISRVGPAVIGIDVCVDGSPLPTYWADGLLVATSSGSTAYSLSAGGPICTPDTRVLIISPIAPHNLNVRPLIVPESSKITIRARSRDGLCVLSKDNSNITLPAGTEFRVQAAPEPLIRLRTGKSNFIEALRVKLHWGEDARNTGE